MGKMSRDKGKRGERAFASLCKLNGYDARRTAQVRGDRDGAADVEGLPGIHVEVKWQEKMKLYDWMAQSVRDAEKGDKNLPIVAHKKNNADWLITMQANDWFTLYRNAPMEVSLNTDMASVADAAVRLKMPLEDLLIAVKDAYINRLGADIQ